MDNYTDLKTEVADFIHRKDLDAKMDTFCLLAESIINKDLRTREMETRLEVSFTDTFTDLPADYLEMRAFQLDVAGGRLAMEQFTPQQLDTEYSRATGRPRAFAIHGGQIEIRPGITNDGGSPIISYDGELSYYKEVDSLIGTPTNDVLNRFPLIYLSAMLIQANTYVQDNEEMQKWASIYMEQINMANKSAIGGRYVTPTVR